LFGILIPTVTIVGVALSQDVYVEGGRVFSPHPISTMNFRAQLVPKNTEGCSSEVVILRINAGVVDFFFPSNGHDTKIKTGSNAVITTGTGKCEVEISIKPK
jgi:hypothetical protein